MRVLGISAFYHDAAAALVVDGAVVAAAQEERFTRIKHDPSFPRQAIAFCLARGGIAPDGLDAVVFYDKPLTTFVRLLRSAMQVAPRGFGVFRRSMPVWVRQKLWVAYQVERGLDELGYAMPGRLTFTEHHESHAASAFFPSPFESAAVLTFDGVGEWATASIGVGRDGELELLRQMRFPDSIGLLYSAVTYHCGFRVNSGEYKLMGLAPYGEPTYVDAMLEHLVDLREDGSFRLNMREFGFLTGQRMTNRRFERLFDGPPRVSESPITRREVDLARSVQEVTERIVLAIAHHASAVTGESHACLAGGVALNCVANSRLQRDGPFERIWVQPAAGDAGGAVGAALLTWHRLTGSGRTPVLPDGMSGCSLGPRFSEAEISEYLEAEGARSSLLPDDATRARRVAELLAEGRVVALFAGRMEFGPRALGNRSILADPRSPTMQSRLNQKVKRRESFRPFAPAVLAERASEWFDVTDEAPYMTFVAQVSDHHLRPGSSEHPDDLQRWLAEVRSDIPAVTHVDGSARLQTVDRQRSPALHSILIEFEALTGCPVLVNTSFNVRGEPIVCTPADAYRCFEATDIDHLVLEHHLVDRPAVPSPDDADAAPVATGR